ncbi:hypothetical protein [Halegenticoccus soli]|uniref:hypothetical protein n=1 Tax=Halegenticoccus soli TaxID=1985678 RepID=UPI000C6EEA14|nr:hypothetical protein [Halegenticoccus soli]
MSVIGAGATFSATSGLARAQRQNESNSDSESDAAIVDTIARELFGGAVIRPRFGYTALSGEKPPIELDYDIELRMRTRTGNGQLGFFFEPTGLSVIYFVSITLQY